MEQQTPQQLQMQKLQTELCLIKLKEFLNEKNAIPVLAIVILPEGEGGRMELLSFNAELTPEEIKESLQQIINSIEIKTPGSNQAT